MNTDDTNFKDNRLYSREKSAIQLIFYNDDFQCSNPLGNKTAKYKVSAFYFSIGNLPAKLRSRLKDIHLVAVTEACVIKKYGYGLVLQKFIDDLKVLV